jgi:hypothetical protein
VAADVPPGDFGDPFAPDLGNLDCEVECLHCGKTGKLRDALVYETRDDFAAWWCTSAECRGAGYKFDVLPVHPARR